ncbi:MAG: phage portal protein [Methylocella sp.]
MGLLAGLSRTPQAARTRAASFEDDLAFDAAPFLQGVRSTAGMQVSQATALQVATVRRCVSVRAVDVARCRPRVLRPNAEGKKEVVTTHPLSGLFVRPNAWQDWFSFCEQMHAGFLLRGNAYAVKIRDWRGNITALIPVNPDLVWIYQAPSGEIFYWVNRAGFWLLAVLKDQPLAIPAEDAFHLRDISSNTLSWLSRITLAREAIGLAMGLEQQAGRWIGNGARPSGILQSEKPLSEATAKRLKENWNKVMAGVHNAGNTAVLEDGIKWSAMQMTSVDLQFIPQRQFTVREICRAFDVPLHKVMEADSQTRATISELNADYVQTTIMGDLTRWERRIEHDFGLGEEGLECKFDEKELLRADILTMRNAARLGFLSGLTTQNEGRAEIGYQPMDGADVLMPPVNLAPHGSAIDGTAPGNGGRPPEGSADQGLPNGET